MQFTKINTLRFLATRNKAVDQSDEIKCDACGKEVLTQAVNLATVDGKEYLFCDGCKLGMEQENGLLRICEKVEA